MPEPDKSIYTFVIILLVAMFLVAAASEAQTVNCTGLADMLAYVKDRYGEVPLFTGTINDQQSVMVTANPAGSDWSAYVLIDGKACPFAGGAGWSLPDAPLLGTEG